MDWASIGQSLASAIVQALTPVIALLVTGIAVQLFKRLGISLEAERQAKLEKDVLDAISRSEERAANHSIAPGAKLTEAISEVTGKYPQLDSAAIADVVHALLPRIGLGATAPKMISVEPMEVLSGSPR